eukprot:15266797-Alexandrium_andersonii.AAC.1
MAGLSEVGHARRPGSSGWARASAWRRRSSELTLRGWAMLAALAARGGVRLSARRRWISEPPSEGRSALGLPYWR